MPVSPEKQQYDSMIGLIESFMERSGRAKEEELRRERDAEAGTPAPPARPTYREYRAVPKNEFDSVDMAKDSSSAPGAKKCSPHAGQTRSCPAATRRLGAR